MVVFFYMCIHSQAKKCVYACVLHIHALMCMNIIFGACASVCMCVCVSMCMCVCVSVCMCVCVSMCMCVCAFAYAYV